MIPISHEQRAHSQSTFETAIKPTGEKIHWSGRKGQVCPRSFGVLLFCTRGPKGTSRFWESEPEDRGAL